MPNRITPTAGVLQVVSEDVSDSDGSPVSTPKPTAEESPGALPDVGGRVHADVEYPCVIWQLYPEDEAEGNKRLVQTMSAAHGYPHDRYVFEFIKHMEADLLGVRKWLWFQENFCRDRENYYCKQFTKYLAAVLETGKFRLVPTSLADSPPTLHEGTETPDVSHLGQDLPLPPNDKKVGDAK
jgi:hypothetical protein